ncbi:MAG: 4-(cytidine 5'-diphospho)-2-C-methyl-D-erythritol kinase [Betaproteobacteria bacterium]|nr:4-(cytidine 5'-diphospho)-2-C-methyl-D-erythritol kinase [Betaproteobacteria bacterium]
MIPWGAPCAAPAKLNLFLHVVGRRADGYHLLQTVFRLVDHGDVLHFDPREDGAVRRAAPIAGVPEDDDLCVRAARLLQREAGVSRGVTIRLDKRLPLGGGLGGGSSDAAATLLALNRLWNVNWPRPRLQELALRLGADVPFFVFGESAFADGVGEVLQPVPLEPAWYLVVEPPVAVATAAIFAAAELTRNSGPIKIADFPAGGHGCFGRNDLQPVVCARYPEVGRALEWLGRFGDARMTGSGACVFCAFRDEAQARQALERLPAGWKGWVARGLDVHPLHGCAA